MSRTNAWCFTINNPLPSDMFAVRHLAHTAGYIIASAEVGKQGTPHIQGYVRFNSGHGRTMATMKKALVRAHLTVANGSDEENKKYCSKDGDVLLEQGTPSEQGKRSDIKEIANMIKNREITLEELMFEYPDMYLRYSRAFEKMFASVLPMRDAAPQVHWRWGKAGVGKTKYVIDKFEREEIYIKDGTSWWDNYKQQKCILIDDFDNGIPYRTLLRILDRNHEQGQIKGGYVYINSPYIYITCEHPPEHYWQGNEYDQVFRRLTSVEEIK